MVAKRRKRRGGRAGPGRLERRIRVSALVLAFLGLLTLTLYYANPEIPVGSLVGGRDPGYSVSFEGLRLRVVLYKIVMENVNWAQGARIGVSLVVGNVTLDYGVYDWTPNVRVLFVNESRTALLDATGRYLVYFRDTLTGYTVPVAVVDSGYRSSFDSLVTVTPFQLHFVFYPDKCQPRVRVDSAGSLVTVRLYSEENGGATVERFTCSQPGCERVVNGCYTDVSVELERSLWGLLRVKSSGGEYYILPGRSPAVLLAPLAPAAVAAWDTARYVRLKRGG